MVDDSQPPDELALEIFHGGRWHPAVRVGRVGGTSRHDPTWLEYDIDYATEHLEARDRWAASCVLPVRYGPVHGRTFPAFFGDLIPQGDARRGLEARLRHVGLPTHDWSLVRHGARSPVGNLRVAPVDTPPTSRGFDREAVIARGEEFRAWAEAEGLPMHGSSDTNGASPKLLLTLDHDGRLHADGALPDARAAKHYLVKFPRGRRRQDEQILANEPAYLELARSFGARCADALVHDRGALFVPRFDRNVRWETPSVGAQGPRVVERAGLESIYALLGVVEPGAALAWEDVCDAVANVVDDPHACLIELLRRDALDLAFGNPDNHGRNTALIKSPTGGISLSPLYDFAPMFLDPDMIKRATRWRHERPGELPDWVTVADHVSARVPRETVVASLRALGDMLDDAPDRMRTLGIDSEIVRAREPHVAAVRDGLRRAC